MKQRGGRIQAHLCTCTTYLCHSVVLHQVSTLDRGSEVLSSAPVSYVTTDKSLLSFALGYLTH